MSTWQPAAHFTTLRKRANIIATIRQFFAARDVLEVETPLLSHFTVTDPYVIGIPAIFKKAGSLSDEILYLQTSPEYAMKRLLAAGSGPIFQICKAFRQGDRGARHNPEFTMLEWYRPSFDHHQLMDEMDLLLQSVLGTPPAERWTYAALFENFLQINPHTMSETELQQCAAAQNMTIAASITNKNTWLDLLWTHCIEPHIAKTVPLFLYDFPVTQAALARVRQEESPPVASRFEVYFKGVELANGFHELQDAEEQRKRFENDLKYRAEIGLSPVSIDEHFLAALSQGLPDCAGVALGIDRLVMLALEEKNINQVMSFHFEHA